MCRFKSILPFIKNLILNHILYTLTLFLICSFGTAQESDFGVWGSMEVRKKVADKCRLSVSTESRFVNSATQLDKQNSEFSVNYSVTKRITIGAAYRFSQENSTKRGFENSHRFSADASMEQTVGRIDLKWRAKYQQGYSRLYMPENKYDPSRTVRNKLTAQYKLYGSRFEPYVSAEFFTPFTYNETFTIADKMRLSAGTGITITKHLSSDLFYLYQTDLFAPAQVAHILGVGLTYKL